LVMSGRVTDPEGQPVADALIQVLADCSQSTV
jgi:protocatechuate 3,4-dioxygenase beta subunit